MYYVGVMTFTVDEITIVTNNFNSAKKIGEGEFESVYQGELRCTAVALKLLTQVLHYMCT